MDVKDSVKNSDGTCKIHWSLDGKKYKPSTFFPSEWPPEKVVKAIIESLKKPSKIKIDPQDLKKIEVKAVYSKINNIVHLEINDAQINISTAYPKAKK